MESTVIPAVSVRRIRFPSVIGSTFSFMAISTSASSMHQKGVEAEQYIRTAQETLAKILKVKEKEIFFTSGGTESDTAGCSIALVMMWFPVLLFAIAVPTSACR